MSGLYAICSSEVQQQLSKRRNGYQEYVVGIFRAYVREEHNSRALGLRVNGRIQMLPKFLEDVRSVASDPKATFFFVEMRDGEAVEKSIERGLSLPLTRSAETLLGIDKERRTAADL